MILTTVGSSTFYYEKCRDVCAQGAQLVFFLNFSNEHNEVLAHMRRLSNEDDAV